MARVDVTARVGFVYDGVPRSEGDVFSCDLSDFSILRTIGKVELAEVGCEPVKAQDPPKRLKADGTPDGRYRRRDLVAEG